MRRQLGEQALILQAVGNVRSELKLASERNASSMETNEILLRLINLYALLDVNGLMGVVVEADAMEDERKVA